MPNRLLQEMEISDQLRAELKDLLFDPKPDDVPWFTTELDCYYEELRGMVDVNEILDLGLLERVYHSARGMLDRWGEFDREQQMVVAAAIRHLILDEEEDMDLDHPLVLEEDAMLLTEVALALDMPDLAVRL